LNETIAWAMSCLAGVGLGTIFFAGLWWTVRRGLSSHQPALWFSISLLLRVTIVLVGFFAVGGGHWRRLLACLLGFLVARLAVTRLTRTPAELPTPLPVGGARAA
jgi:F1F0 ATPase subunit 2